MKHLLEEPPILVYPSLAKIVGINKAIMLQQLHFLLGVAEQAKNEYVFVDGFWWVYNSYQEWKDRFFVWLSTQSIRDNFQEMEEAGYVVTTQSVKNASDRKKWYRIDYDRLDEFLSENSSLMDYKVVDDHGLESSRSIGQKVVDGYSETPTESPEEKKNPEPTAQVSSRIHSEKPNSYSKVEGIQGDEFSEEKTREYPALFKAISAHYGKIPKTISKKDKDRFGKYSDEYESDPIFRGYVNELISKAYFPGDKRIPWSKDDIKATLDERLGYEVFKAQHNPSQNFDLDQDELDMYK